MFRRLEALTPTHSPLLNNFRAANGHNMGAFQSDISNIEEGPHTHHVATTHTTITPVNQAKPSPGTKPSYTSRQREAPVAKNELSGSAKREGSGGVRDYKSSVGCFPTTYSPVPPTTTTLSPSYTHPPILSYALQPVLSSAPVSTSSHVHTGQVSGRPTHTWSATPPSSPEMRRAWNVLGVPVRNGGPAGRTSQLGRSPSPAGHSPSPARHSPPPACHSPSPARYSQSPSRHSPSPAGHSLSPAGHSMSPSRGSRPGPEVTASHSEADTIYDNLVVRHPPLAAPSGRAAPTASVTPTITPHPHTASVPPTVTNHPQTTASTYLKANHASPPRVVACSPLLGKPPSPPMQRRASRSPTPTIAWKPSNSHHCVPYYPPPEPQYGGYWVPMWGSSPQLFQSGGGHVYPAYVYSGPPGAVLVEGRSQSCDRLPARPSSPSSPRNGRRSASPWRGGSASPVGLPPPTPDSGRPPRPRRPPHRKSKTVEVGCLGLLAHPPSNTAMPVVVADHTPVPQHSVTFLSSPTSRIPSNQLYIKTLDHHNTPAYHGHINPRLQRVPHISTIPEQNGTPGNESDVNKPRTGQASSPVTQALIDVPISTSLYSSSPLSSPLPVFVKQEHAESSRHKVTYKSSFYKCMKNFLKPIQ
nr:uncharacterized protein LOC128701730 [Cherax quadricarinatus]